MYTEPKLSQHLGQEEDNMYRYNQHCEKNEIVLKDDRWSSPVTTWRPYMIRKYDKGDQPRGGEMAWTNTGATRYGRGQLHKTGNLETAC